MVNKLFWIKRTLQVVTMFALFAVIAYQFITLQNESNAVRFQQTEKFSYSLTNLAAAEASRYLSQKNQENLQLLIDDLSEDPIVRDAIIYDKLGQILYQSKASIPLPVLLKIGGKQSDEAEGVIPYIAELYDDGTKIGYIRIALEQKRILSLIQNYQQRGLSIMSLLILLSFIAGTLLTAIFYKKVTTIYRQLISEIPKLIERTKKEATK
ncbi:AhpA/YtjB family protein [uncultured Psychromonas sp.]|uniref:AhpA/YtjB family protein n=1 Tax=uncultured Psychromonas sp. TaxID=173974 RepID=UPI00261CF10A|nr:AhpA/YtjB family protein [uncultured Psychromonas sp.]